MLARILISSTILQAAHLPPAREDPPQIHSTFGSAVAGIGDVDGDGAADVLVGDSGEKDVRVWVVSLKKKKVIHSIALDRRSPYGRVELCGLGDVDGDGHPDWIVGGDSSSFPGPAVYSGSTGRLLRRLEEEATQGAVGSIGDLDHDGHADVLLAVERTPGCRECPIARVRSGRDGSTLLAVGRKEPPGWTAEQVVGIGDVDGDGAPDIGVLTRFTQTDLSSVLVFSGKTGEVLRRIPRSIGDSALRLRACGDLDGDGRADLLIGSRSFARVLSGRDLSILREIPSDPAPPAKEIDWESPFGFDVACLRDRSRIHAVPAIAVSDPNTDVWGGTVFLHSFADGTLRALLRDVDADNALLDPSVPSIEVHHLGSSLANLGDVDGDGYDDLACGAENWGGGEDGQAFVLDGLSGKVLYELRRRGDDVIVLEPASSRREPTPGSATPAGRRR